MTNSDIPNYTPDAAWDYYIIWHRCMRAKAKIEQALTLMSKQEEENTAINADCDELISHAIYELNEIQFDLEEEEK
ncbi:MULTISPECIES: hypothetical protein [unclassified Tolypothrix]|uniref:hypothetical protein n=1 Tax=unclassified Tolypothrix TaxID=2649714 RepID=UPI0005EAA5DC|nr:MULTISPECIES: hypothetical protein [unclassified Tolypothrix]BAY89644.1 hypothetical protein NIES3275_16470 [Microchaete diplosiphon NIES-3275]EKE97660.1 hypothetical protein FDUTEX481_05038 [Tolypothrix sp. PCC 7601]MBE9083236.1 hypothetical protein [Tolypothrix sp. LEGE 11397]UYD23914.1 hypothetical protein HGR01_20655 [Tolypothrix sp. PCC 7712]UYD33861.1 hypothetical protein HG267_34100 [Tolypothrix sp. PCC 7601]